MIDELAEALKSQKGYTALSFWDKLSDRVSTAESSYKPSENPVSSSEQVGSSEKRGAVNINSLFKILGNIESTKDTKIATNMLSSTLDQLLSFKHLFTTVENEIQRSFPIDMKTTGSFSVSTSGGKGAIKISNVLSEQVDVLSSLSFNIENASVSFGEDGTISIEYSCDIDQYSTITASVSGRPKGSLSVGYTITTTDKYDNSVSTRVGMTHSNNLNNKNMSPETVPVPVPEKEKEEPIDWGLLEKARQVAVATGLSIVTVLAIAETVGTFGAGFWNDIPSATVAIAAWAKVFGVAS